VFRVSRHFLSNAMTSSCFDRRGAAPNLVRRRLDLPSINGNTPTNESASPLMTHRLALPYDSYVPMQRRSSSDPIKAKGPHYFRKRPFRNRRAGRAAPPRGFVFARSQPLLSRIEFGIQHFTTSTVSAKRRSDSEWSTRNMVAQRMAGFPRCGACH
jgi:hypothetical protein